jgi:hypothetical protein
MTFIARCKSGHAQTTELPHFLCDLDLALCDLHSYEEIRSDRDTATDPIVTCSWYTKRLTESFTTATPTTNARYHLESAIGDALCAQPTLCMPQESSVALHVRLLNLVACGFTTCGNIV